MASEAHLGGRVVLHQGDCRDVLRSLADASIDSVVTDPPYALVSIAKRFGKAGAAPAAHGRDGLYARASAGFMGQTWDTGEVAFAAEFWAEVLRVLKPGGHVVAFSGTRTYHRMVVAIEDAGFEIRDQLAWVYGSGFPKSHDVAKGVDAMTLIGTARTTDMRRLAMGDSYEPSNRGRVNFDHGGGSVMNGHTGRALKTDAAREWQGWGTALKPAWEPIVLARKPLIGTVAANVLEYRTGGLNVDGCLVGEELRSRSRSRSLGEKISENMSMASGNYAREIVGQVQGRWPANIVHDGSEHVASAFPGLGADSAARFFYSAKADAHDRVGSKHPTIKPVDLMQWLCRLVTPPGGTVLDPFAGSGTTGEAAWREGFHAVLIERETAYCADIRRRLRLAERPAERAAVAKAKGRVADDHGPLFGGSS